MSIPGSRLGIPSAPGTHKHRRLEGMPVSVTVGTPGTATFTWPGVPADEIWTGAVSVPLAVPSSVLPILWSATDGGTPIGQWYNSQSSGPLQVNTQLQVTGSNIASGALVATLQGIATDLASAPPWWPAPTPAPPPSGFTTIVSGIGNATAITANPQYLTATGGLSATPVWFPVVVGTALEIAYFGANAVSQRLTPLWSTTGTGTGTVVHNADTFDLSFISPNNVMQGMTYLNHGPFVAFLIQGVGGTPQIVVNTGLPPIVRPPSVPQGMLIGQNIAAAVVGDTTIAIPPYVGPAVLSLLLNSTAPNSQFYAHITHTDYLGNDLGSTWLNPQASADTGRLANVDPIILPILVNLPPVINKLVITNSTAAPARIYATLIPAGP
jgi:hypothetical protein